MYMSAEWMAKGQMKTQRHPRRQLGTNFQKFPATEHSRQEDTYIGLTRINFAPCLFSGLVKDRPFHSACLGRFSVSSAVEILHASEEEKENVLPSPVWLLGCQDGTEDRWKGRSNCIAWKTREGNGGATQSPVI